MKRQLARAGAITAALAAVFCISGGVLQSREPVPVRTLMFALGTPRQAIIATRAGRAFIPIIGPSKGSSYFAVVDIARAALVRTIALPDAADAGAASVDERTSRVFVVRPFVNTVAILDARTSALLHIVPVGRGSNEPPRIVVDTQADRVFVVANGTIVALDARVGVVLHRFGANILSLAVDEAVGHLFSIDDIGSISTWDARSGALLRTTRIGRGLASMVTSGTTARVFVQGDSTITMLDSFSGRLLQTLTPSISHSATMVMDNMNRYLLVVDPPMGRIILFNAHTGATDHVIAVDPATLLEYPLEIDELNGRIVTIGADGVSGMIQTRLFDLHRGGTMRTVSLDSTAQAIMVEQRTGRVLIADSNRATNAGQVIVLDGRTGRVIRVMAVCVGPQTMADDVQTGRVVVTCAGGYVYPADGWSWMPPWLRQLLPFVPHGSLPAQMMPSGVSIINAVR